jgi:hypothetical protein
VYLTEAVAQTQTDDSTALATHSLAEITNDHMRTWGQIKIAKHNPQYANETWQGIEHKLERDWGFFTTQQRQAVVRDIAGTGDLYLAGAYANKIADRFSTADERRVQTESVIEIAYQQAEVQPYNGIHTLRNARSAAAQRLAEVVEGVGEVGGTIPLTAKQHAFNSLRAEYTDRVNMLTAHEIAAQVHLDPDAAVSAMRNATFIGTQPGVYKSRVRRVVAEQLARVGRIEQAAAIAAEIPDDSDSDAQKSQAFTAIARSVRQQRNAIGQ